MKISTGQKAAIQILIALELGFKISYKEEAEKFLKHDKINPMLTIPFLQESDRATDLILRNDLLNKAIQLSEKYF